MAMGSTASPQTFFFYGTLQATDVYRRVVTNGNLDLLPRHCVQYRPCTVRGYKRVCVKNCDYPAMIPGTAADSVQGMLCDVPEQVYADRLDAFEGEEYIRQLVTAQPSDDPASQVPAHAYIFVAGDHFLELDKEWDFDRFKKDKLDIWVRGEEDRLEG